jgi:hypothetical protein
MQWHPPDHCYRSRSAVLCCPGFGYVVVTPLKEFLEVCYPPSQRQRPQRIHLPSLSLPLGLLNAQVSTDMFTGEHLFRVESTFGYEIRVASQTKTAFHKAS